MSAKIILLFFLGALTLSAGDNAGLLEKAETAERSFLAADTPEESQRDLRTAIESYEAILNDGIANADLYGKLGALYLQAGDLGRSILNLRKGLILAPRDRAMLGNLALARQRRADQFQPTEASGVLRTLAFFHYEIGYSSRLSIALAAWACLALVALAMLWRRPAWLATLAILFAIVALLFGTSAAVTAYSLRHNRIAVVTNSETTPRKGDGDAYASAINAPVHAGTELVLLGQRGDWSHVILPGDIPAWIRSADLAQ